MKIQQTGLRRGFTIIELLAVIAIIAILSGLSFGTFLLVNRNANEKKTRVIIENVSLHLDAYVNEGEGPYPDGNGGAGSTEEIVKILSGGEITDNDRKPRIPQADPEYTGKGKMVQQINGKWVLVDGFGNEMLYRGPNSSSRVNNMENGYDLWSIGADGEEVDQSEDDDITNW